MLSVLQILIILSLLLWGGLYVLAYIMTGERPSFLRILLCTLSLQVLALVLFLLRTKLFVKFTRHMGILETPQTLKLLSSILFFLLSLLFIKWILTVSFKRAMIVSLVVFILSQLFFWTVSKSFFQFHCLPSSQMMPIIHQGDCVMIDIKSYITESPKRGDIVAFYPPNTKSRIMVSRIIGLSDETIVVPTPSAKGQKRVANKYAIPAGCYFCQEENRDMQMKNSLYSGVIPGNRILGKVELIAIPRLSDLLNFSRYFSSIGQP